MKELFVPYNLALLAKEKMFLDDCLAYYVEGKLKICKDGMTPVRQVSFMSFNHPTKYCTAPLYQQIVDWFREKHKLAISLPNPEFGWYKILGGRINIENKAFDDAGFSAQYSNSELWNKAIQEAFKLI